MAESPISSPEAPLGRGAVERSGTERLLLQRPLIFCYLLFFSFRLFGLLLLTQLFDALFLALDAGPGLSLIHLSEPTRLLSISYAVFCLHNKALLIL